MINETDTKKGNSMDLNRQLIEADGGGGTLL